jgi:hypothetical protein
MASLSALVADLGSGAGAGADRDAVRAEDRVGAVEDEPGFGDEISSLAGRRSC